MRSLYGCLEHCLELLTKAAIEGLPVFIKDFQKFSFIFYFLRMWWTHLNLKSICVLSEAIELCFLALYALLADIHYFYLQEQCANLLNTQHPCRSFLFVGIHSSVDLYVVFQF